MENFDWIMGALLPYINFAIFLFLAIKFFRKPLADIAAKRKTDFESLFAEAERVKKEAEEQKNALDLRLAAIDSEVASILENAKNAAQKEKNQMIADARELAVHIQQEAERIAEAEIDNAVREIKTTIVDEVKQRVIEKYKNDLSGSDHEKILVQQTTSLKNLEVGKLIQ